MVIMAGRGHEITGIESIVATDATESHICTTTTDLAQLQAEIEELNTGCTVLSTMRSGITPVELFESNFIKLDEALAGHMIAMSICGGIIKNKNQAKAQIIPWHSTDPDTRVRG
eukprot:12754770-Ditylum_brightwellii.AAC.1